MANKFLTQQEKIYLRTMKNKGQKIPKQVKNSIFNNYNPNLNIWTNTIEK